MPFYRHKDMVLHMKGRNLPKPCSEYVLLDGKKAVCSAFSAFLCDGPGQGHRTCDRPLCEAHATQAGPNRHLCPACRTAASDASGQRSLFTHLVHS